MARFTSVKVPCVMVLAVTQWLTAQRALAEQLSQSSSFWGIDAGVGLGNEEHSSTPPIARNQAQVVFQPGAFWQKRLSEVFWLGPRASWRLAAYDGNSGHAVDLSAYGVLSWPADGGVEGRLAFAIGPVVRFPPQLASVAIEHQLDPAVSAQAFLGIGLARTSASGRFRIHGDLRIALSPHSAHRHQMRDSRTGETASDHLRIATLDVQLVFGIGGLSR